MNKKTLFAAVILGSLLLLTFFVARKKMISPSASVNNITAYQNEIEEWHQHRISSLKKGNSWLALAGLYWLKEGENSFGGNADNDVVFPAGKLKVVLVHLYCTKEWLP
ncbi:hypothetical protein ACFSKU_19610 [Pontibacter silvestris]|uniref:Uncharacterized protein n=1 Tax=Pontibacter silvestris TaxID=2305183 RepID=A0ABW4X4S7_9BACT|nr:hypothetical protein [Pontibacter silvestris]MCC9134904.1 hypothetical protein [Pontibacter silvestris]